MSPIWVDGEDVIRGTGQITRFDPGVGRQRYQLALDTLRGSGSPLALASFTFDPLAGGSVVLIPETVDSTSLSAATRSTTLDLIDDGVSRWNDGFDTMSAALAEGMVRKVVLARHVTASSSVVIDTEVVARKLREHGEATFVFDVDGLVGASPELLLRLQDGQLTTNVLAGTATDVRELDSDRIRLEHELAVSSAVDALTPHMRFGPTTSRATRAQGQMIHLATKIDGPVLPGTNFADVLADLHPTAAVAGTPSDVAIDLIRSSEPARGRYAGPIGWFDTTGDCVFALALRCAFIDGKHATLYAGGGLVFGSDRDQELAETEMKLSPIRRALA